MERFSRTLDFRTISLRCRPDGCVATPSRTTIDVGIRDGDSLSHGGTEWHYLMAASTLVALPIIVLFFFTQKTFIEGISMTGIKG